MTRVAAIDCGTNSIRLLVADVDGEVKTDHLREMRIVRLGEGVDRTGRLDPAAVGRAVEATREFVGQAEVLGAEVVRFCATSAARDAANADEFLDAIESVVGVRPEILSGDAEARASFLGATRDVGQGPTVVADIGGGSTELVAGDGEQVDHAESFDIGSVRLTERFLASDPPTIAEITELIDHLDDVLAASVDGWSPIERFVGVAGTVTTVAAHALGLDSYDSARIHGAVLPVPTVRAACVSLVQMPVADRRALPFMHHGRADVIGAGALILDRLLEVLPLATGDVLVSERDILDGIAWGAVEAPGR
ncbi:Ppx/GppA phosphatase family protein [Aeromicrobium marinum DSM 15272]|uniref:Ppx/GppA phosphatase family protein n=1 Tax=Aeromicrobium marinum DSM 15272 TaxID=585531 RepID=E2SBK3_9ACTN|nr:Ppx/GppA phosphatase family protein [Aeromicrobium marinum]EFQ83749.1 Ppx/GppA phosphatase family protein [Aeromicrobium marinum DSM 15272]